MTKHIVRCTSKSPFILNLNGKNEDILPMEIYTVDIEEKEVARRLAKGDLFTVSEVVGDSASNTSVDSSINSTSTSATKNSGTGNSKSTSNSAGKK